MLKNKTYPWFEAFYTLRGLSTRSRLWGPAPPPFLYDFSHPSPKPKSEKVFYLNFLRREELACFLPHLAKALGHSAEARLGAQAPLS